MYNYGDYYMGGKVMFENIDKKIKTLSEVVFWLSLIIGGLWFLIAISYYQESREIIYRNHIIYSIVLVIWGVISSYFIYGFGEIINHLKRIDYNLNGEPKEEDETEVKLSDRKDIIYDDEEVPIEEIIAELEKDSEEN